MIDPGTGTFMGAWPPGPTPEEEQEKLTFEEWYLSIEIETYNKTEYECMKMAWDASKEN